MPPQSWSWPFGLLSVIYRMLETGKLNIPQSRLDVLGQHALENHSNSLIFICTFSASAPQWALLKQAHLFISDRSCFLDVKATPFALSILCCYLRLIDSKYRTTLACMNYGFSSREKTSSEYWSTSQATVRGEPGWCSGLPSHTFP